MDSIVKHRLPSRVWVGRDAGGAGVTRVGQRYEHVRKKGRRPVRMNSDGAPVGYAAGRQVMTAFVLRGFRYPNDSMSGGGVPTIAAISASATTSAGERSSPYSKRWNARS